LPQEEEEEVQADEDPRMSVEEKLRLARPRLRLQGTLHAEDRKKTLSSISISTRR
jgi:hypothetical protein